MIYDPAVTTPLARSGHLIWRACTQIPGWFSKCLLRVCHHCQCRLWPGTVGLCRRDHDHVSGRVPLPIPARARRCGARRSSFSCRHTCSPVGYARTWVFRRDPECEDRVCEPTLDWREMGEPLRASGFNGDLLGFYSRTEDRGRSRECRGRWRGAVESAHLPVYQGCSGSFSANQ